MKYILDGYNVIGATNHILLTEKNKEALFIAWLRPFIKKNDHIVVVFDGKNQHLPFSTKQHDQQLTIIQTDPIETADDYICRVCIKSNKRLNIIVSSDHDIQKTAKQVDCKYMGASEFLLNYCKRIHDDEKPTFTNSERQINYWLAEFNSD